MPLCLKFMAASRAFIVLLRCVGLGAQGGFTSNLDDLVADL